MRIKLTDEERKEKARVRTRKWRQENIERALKSCREYQKNSKDKLLIWRKGWLKENSWRTNESQKKWRQNNKDKIKEKNRKYRKREDELRKLPENIEKCRARKSIYYRVTKGEIMRPHSCEICQKKCVPDGHHKDYSKPFEVTWVCKSCHGIIHRKRRGDE